MRVRLSKAQKIVLTSACRGEVVAYNCAGKVWFLGVYPKTVRILREMGLLLVPILPNGTKGYCALTHIGVEACKVAQLEASKLASLSDD